MLLYRSYHAQVPGAVDTLHEPLHAGVGISSAKGIKAVSALKTGKTIPANMKTLGAIVTSRTSNQKLILSSASLIVDSKTPSNNILMQPGIPVDFSGPSGVGRITSAAQLQTRRAVGMGKQVAITNQGGHFVFASTSNILPGITVSHEIPGIGLITGVKDPVPGMRVKCLSHAVGLRSGVVSQTGFNGTFNSATFGNVTFQGAFSASIPATYSDLGGVLVEEGTNKAVGIIYTTAGAAHANDVVEEVRCCNASALEAVFGIDFVGKPGTFTGDGQSLTPTRDPSVVALTPTRMPSASSATEPSSSPLIPDLPAASDFLDFLKSSPSSESSNSINIGGVNIPYIYAFGALGLVLLVVLLKK